MKDILVLTLAQFLCTSRSIVGSELIVSQCARATLRACWQTYVFSVKSSVKWRSPQSAVHRVHVTHIRLARSTDNSNM